MLHKIISSTKETMPNKKTNHDSKKIKECRELLTKFREENDIRISKKQLIEKAEAFIKKEKKTKLKKEFLYVLLRKWIGRTA